MVFSYRLDRDGLVNLSIYDISGRRVATLAEARLAAGEHSVSWPGIDAAGRRLASGIYLYRLTANGRTATGKLTLVK